MTSQVPAIFEALAEKFRVPPATLAVLAEEGLETCDDFFYRIPTEDMLTKFIDDVVRLYTAQMIEEKMCKVPRSLELVESTDTFSRGAEAAAVRRLW